MALDLLNKYEKINQKVNRDINQSFQLFNNKRYANSVPLSRREIRNEIEKESSHILFSLKNKIKYKTIENHNEILFFHLTEHNLREVRRNLIDIKSQINEINNKIKVLQDKNRYEKISIDNNKNNLSQQIYMGIIKKEKIFLKYYETIKQKIPTLEKNQKEINIKTKNKIEKDEKNTNSLNDLKQNIKSLIDSTKNNINKKLDIINETNKKLSNTYEIKNLKECLTIIKRNLEKINDKRKFVPVIVEFKSNINKLKNNIENSVINKIKLSLKENNEILKKLINNLNKISNLKDNTNKNLQESKNIVKVLNDIRMSSLSKIVFDKMSNEIQQGIYNLNQEQILIDYEFKILFENIEKNKNISENLVKKIDYYEYIKNIRNKYNEIKNNLAQKFDTLEENKNLYTNMISTNIVSRKNKIDSIKKEKNMIISKTFEIQSLIEKNLDENKINKQNLQEIKINWKNFIDFIKKYNLINNNVTNQKKEIKQYNKKIYAIENMMKNITLDNLDYQKTLRRSISNYFFENKKKTNKIKRYKLLNKSASANLIFCLKSLDKTFINNKTSLENHINNYIKKQKEINKRSKEYIKYNNKIIHKNKIETIKKLKSFKDKINKIIKIYIRINENNKVTKQKIKNIQDLLIKKQREIDEEFYQIRLYLKNKIKTVNK